MSSKGFIRRKRHLSRENEFLIFALEYYRNAKNLTGREAADLFARHDIYRLILDNYFLYHIESPNHFVYEIDERIRRGPSWTPALSYSGAPH